MNANSLKTRYKVFLTTLALCFAARGVEAEESKDDVARYSQPVQKYLGRIYADEGREFTFRDDYPGGFEKWHQDARRALHQLVGLDKIVEQVGEHQPTVQLDDAEDLENYTRRKGWIETEPDVRIPFWLLRPKGAGPFPLAILPHGHDRIGLDSHAGVFHDEEHRRKTLGNEKDVAVQAVQRGFLAIAPATRGLAVDGVPDVLDRHGNRDCRSQLVHCLLAGRTAIGERVWDLSRILDWALELPESNGEHVLMMGNSGGGMATLYTAALDKRVTIAVPSCSFTTVASPDGRIYHCDCNLVPGILNWGDLYDVAGLIAPRHMLAINGRQDSLHEAVSIERAARRALAIFEAAGHADGVSHSWGDGGHRFYSDLMWPFIMEVVNDPS